MSTKKKCEAKLGVLSKRTNEASTKRTTVCYLGNKQCVDKLSMLIIYSVINKIHEQLHSTDYHLTFMFLLKK